MLCFYQIQFSGAQPHHIGYLAGALAFLTFVLHAACFLTVWGDAGRTADRPGGTVLLWPFLWALIALLLGPLGLGLYWVLNHSTLHPDVAAGAFRGSAGQESSPHGSDA